MSDLQAALSVLVFGVILWLVLSGWAALVIIRAWLQEVWEADRRAAADNGTRVDW